MGKSNSKEKILQNQVAAVSQSMGLGADLDESTLEKDPIFKTMNTKKKVSQL